MDYSEDFDGNPESDNDDEDDIEAETRTYTPQHRFDDEN